MALGKYSWLGNVSGSSDSKSVKSMTSKNGITKDRVVSNTRSTLNKYVSKTNTVKKDKDYTELLEEQLQEEISHRQQLEELNLQLVDQMKQLKQQQIRLWANAATSSGSEQSFQASSRSYDMSSSSGSTSSVPIDQNTLSYIQQAFRDIYAYIKNNQCQGQCLHESQEPEAQAELVEVTKVTEIEEYESNELRINMVPKKAQSSHIKWTENVKMNKTTKSAHLLGEQHITNNRDIVEMKPEMFEKQMGDTKFSHIEETSYVENTIPAQIKPKKNIYERGSPNGSVVSDSSDTLVCSPRGEGRPRTAAPAPAPASTPAFNPREALYSSTDDDSS